MDLYPLLHKVLPTNFKTYLTYMLKIKTLQITAILFYNIKEALKFYIDFFEPYKELKGI